MRRPLRVDLSRHPKVPACIEPRPVDGGCFYTRLRRRSSKPNPNSAPPSRAKLAGSGTTADTTMLSMFVDVPRMFVVTVKLSMTKAETPLSSVAKVPVFVSWVPVTLKTGAPSSVPVKVKLTLPLLAARSSALKVNRPPPSVTVMASVAGLPKSVRRRCWALGFRKVALETTCQVLGSP